jgi:cell wall-associated NlpC family hydrolase
MLTPEQREAIVAEAASWVGTPYRGWSAVKGPHGGTDCGMIIKAVYQTLGLIPNGGLGIDMTYSLQVAQHLADPTYLNHIETFMREIPEEEVQAGDVVVYKLGLAFAHAGIIVKWPLFIHALGHGGVRFSDGLSHPKLRNTTRKFYTLKDAE